MPQQRNMKGRKSGSPRQLRARRCGTYLPAGLRGAWCGRHPHAQHEKRHTRGFREKLQTSAGREVEFTWIPPGRNHDGPKRGAAGRLGPRAQNARAITDPDQQEALGAKPQFRQTGRIDRPGLTIGKLLPDPAQRPSLPRPTGQNARKSGRIGTILEAGRIDLMDCSALQSAVQMTVECGKTQGKMPVSPLPAHGRTRAEGRCQIAGKEGSSHHTATYVHFTFYNSRFIRGRVKRH